ncbi:P68 family surface lipoprotein [Mycoplasmopsis agalactiae]|uniref:P68 family surface lipoprotein n=1 Tax=Mycoplasmopsis agalactiae TaxID=2110 RepID=UPI001F8FE1F9|nr:P80 family lipoprotein [Mycoplasmopsis agalactiae]MCE6115350.1 P80 family lipoprotein [Mycoplasmopsis agalactiae]
MNKKNKLMIWLSSATIPIFAAVSAKCVDKDYEELGKDTQKIFVGMTFSSGQPQWNAMASLIHYYNETHKNDKHFLPVAPKHLGSGYAEGENSIIKDLEVNKKEVVNLTFNYNSLAAKLASKKITDRYKREKLLNFEDDDKDINVNLDNINEQFTTANKTTENLPKNGSFIIPIFKSITVMSANAPVLQYIFKTFEEKGAKFDESFKTSEKYKQIMQNGKGDEEHVKKLWGEFESSQTDAVKNLTIKQSTFENFKELLTFADIAQKSFKNSAARNSRLHILGVDDVSSVVQTLPYSLVNKTGDFFITTRNKNRKTSVSYSSFKNSNNPGVQALSRVYEKFKQSLESKSLTLLAGGEYTSSYQTKHEYALGIGSTAGYRHNFLSDKSEKTILTVKGTDFKGEKDLEFKNVAKSKDGKEILVVSKGHANNIYKSTTNTDKLDDKKKESLPFSFISVDASTDAKLDEALKKVKETDHKKAKDQWLLFLREDSKHDIESVKKGQATEIGTVKETKDKDPARYKVFFFENHDQLQKEELSSTGTLQENELIAFSVPGRWDESSKRKVVYAQGPSLMGISNGAKPDRAAKNFVKFLTSLDKIDITLGNYDKDNNLIEEKQKYTGVTPAFFISDVASYVFPVKGFENTDTSKYKNKYIVHTYNELKETVKNKDVVIYEEPAGFYSSSFRENLGSAFRSAYQKAKNNEALKDFDTEIKGQVTTLSSSFINN